MRSLLWTRIRQRHDEIPPWSTRPNVAAFGHRLRNGEHLISRLR